MSHIRIWATAIMIAALFNISAPSSLAVNNSIGTTLEPSCPDGRVCHLVHDPVDDFWYCLGSPQNCCCDFKNER